MTMVTYVYLRLRLRTFPCPSSSTLCTLVLIFCAAFALFEEVAFALFEEVVDEVVVEEDEVVVEEDEVVEVVVVVSSLHSSTRSKSGGIRTESMPWTIPAL